MDSRLSLHADLKELIGNNNVYYQAPSTGIMQYPAILYKRNSIFNRAANNKIYSQAISYKITVLDKNPDSILFKKMSVFKNARHINSYVSDGVYHETFEVTDVYY